MAHSEASSFLRGARPDLGDDASWTSQEERLSSRQKVLIIGDKRPRIYRRYRSSAVSGRQRARACGGRYQGLPLSDALTTPGTGVFTDGLDQTGSKSWKRDSAQADDGDVSGGETTAEMGPTAQSEWKLVLGHPRAAF